MIGMGTGINERVLSGKRLGVFGKGGSGKSTVVVLLARGFLDTGYDVCILDADSTNIGMKISLVLSKNWKKPKNSHRPIQSQT